MKHARYAIVLVVMIAAALVGTGFGQSGAPLKANIPFDFQVGNTMLPAGEYRLDQMNSILLLASADNGAHAAIAVRRCETLKGQEKSKLVFHRYGSDYFLSTIWVAGDNAGREVPTSNREKEIAKLGGSTEVALLLHR